MCRRVIPKFFDSSSSMGFWGKNSENISYDCVCQECGVILGGIVLESCKTLVITYFFCPFTLKAECKNLRKPASSGNRIYTVDLGVKARLPDRRSTSLPRSFSAALGGAYRTSPAQLACLQQSPQPDGDLDLPRSTGSQRNAEGSGG